MPLGASLVTMTLCVIPLLLRSRPHRTAGVLAVPLGLVGVLAILLGLLGVLAVLLHLAGVLGGGQGLLDESQDELPLGVLPAQPKALPVQVRLDALEEFLRDLERHRSAAVVRHVHVPSVFFHLVVFDEQVGDVLCGGQAHLILLGAYPVVEAQGDLSAEVLGIGHRVLLLSHLLTQV